MQAEFSCQRELEQIHLFIAEKLSKRELEQTHLFIAECSQLWIKSAQPKMGKAKPDTSNTLISVFNF